MEIKSTLINRSGQTLITEYRDIDSTSDLDDRKVHGVHAFCFSGDKLVIVYSAAKGYWTPPGGGVEQGETVEDAVTREVQEETNMRVLKQRPIGTLQIFESDFPKFQIRSVCIVEPIGPFVADPDLDEGVTEIRLINPTDTKQYFDWGIVGDHLMKRALEIKAQMDSDPATQRVTSIDHNS